MSVHIVVDSEVNEEQSTILTRKDVFSRTVVRLVDAKAMIWLCQWVWILKKGLIDTVSGYPNLPPPSNLPLVFDHLRFPRRRNFLRHLAYIWRISRVKNLPPLVFDHLETRGGEGSDIRWYQPSLLIFKNLNMVFIRHRLQEDSAFFCKSFCVNLNDFLQLILATT